MNPPDVAAVLVAVALASTVQATAGFGFALTAMPLLSTTVGAERGLAIVSIVALFNSATTWATARRHVNRAAVIAMTAGAVAGMPAGLLVLGAASERLMRILVALSVAAAAILLGLRFRLTHVGKRADWYAGFVSGALSTSTGTSGPPLVFTLQARELPAAEVRASLAAQFVTSGVISIALLAIFGHVRGADVALSAISLPVLVVTWTAGARLFGRLHQHHYDRLVIAMLLAISAVALVRAL